MANVSYETKQVLPAGSRLIFKKQQGDVVSETISMTFKIIIDQLAPRPIRQVTLLFEMLYPEYYEFLDKGNSFTKEFNNISADFTTPEITFQVKITDPSIPLEREVRFEVTVMDADEGVPFPAGGHDGFYSWEPVPPPTASLLNSIPNNII